MNISDIDLNYKKIIKYNEKPWFFNDDDCHSIPFKFELTQRKENVFLFKIWKRRCIPDYDGFGSPYRLGDWELNGISEFTIPVEIIENESNYESLLYNEIVPRLFSMT